MSCISSPQCAECVTFGLLGLICYYYRYYYYYYYYYSHMPIGKVWICRLLFVCTDTDFFAEDKSSKVTFCSAIHRRHRRSFVGSLLRAER